MPKTVTLTRQLKAPAERVFRAWTDPADVKRWFKPTRLIMDAKVDGLWHSEVEWQGKRWPHYGRFTRLERPRLFEQTWMSEATHGLESVVRVELEAKGGGTEVRLTHSGLPDDEAENHRRRRRLTLRCRLLRCRLLSRLLHQTLPLQVPLQHQIQSRLQNILRRCQWMRMGKRGPRGLQLLQEAPGNGDVEPGQFRRERFGRIASGRFGMQRRRRRVQFNRLNQRRGRWAESGRLRQRGRRYRIGGGGRADRSDDVAVRRSGGWLDGRRHGLASRFDRWKNLGSISRRFCGVSTFARWVMLVMHKRPSRRGSTISGNRCTSFAAVFR